MPANRTIEQVGANSVPVMTTGNEKNIMYCCFSMFFKWIKAATNGNGKFPDKVVVKANEKECGRRFNAGMD